MFKKAIYLFAITFLLFALTACDSKTETKVSKATDAISVINPTIREMPPGQKVTAMYMELKNASATNHELIKVEGEISPMIELHTHTMNDGVMSMGQVESIPVPPNSTVQAQPGGYHVMIMGLSSDLKKGDKVNFNFVFKDGSKIPVTAEVNSIVTN